MKKYHIISFFKVLVLASIGIYVYCSIDVNSVISKIRTIPLEGVALSLAALLFALFLTAYRWQFIINATLEKKRSFMWALSQVLKGHALSQALPGSIGGDAYRFLQLKKDTPTLECFMVIALDRIIGLISFFIVGLLMLPFYYKDFNSSLMEKILVIYAFIMVGIIVVLISKNKVIKFIPTAKLCYEFFYKLFKRENLFNLIFCSLSVALIFNLPVYILAVYLSLSISFLLCCLIMPIVFISLALPISFSGWGVREGMFITLFGAFGVSSESALALSLMYGVILILGAIPSLFFIFERLFTRKINEI